MVRRLLTLLLLTLVLVPFAPAQASHRGDIYSKDHYDNPYSFDDDECDFTFHVEGRVRGYEVIYNVPGSHGQAFLDDNRYRFRETWTNPDSGRTATVTGAAHYREISATHVRGDIWDFVSVTTGRPFTVRGSKGGVVLSDHGRLVEKSRFDTLGDSKPGGDVIRSRILRMSGHFPSYQPNFDFCALAERVVG